MPFGDWEVLQGLEEGMVPDITDDSAQQTRSCPFIHRGFAYFKLRAHFLRGQQAAFSQPPKSTLEMIGAANPCHFLQVERLVLPSPPSLLVKDVSYLTITVLVEQTVDFSDKVGRGLANLGDR